VRLSRGIFLSIKEIQSRLETYLDIWFHHMHVGIRWMRRKKKWWTYQSRT
jgi:hypothetical protein